MPAARIERDGLPCSDATPWGQVQQKYQYQSFDCPNLVCRAGN